MCSLPSRPHLRDQSRDTVTSCGNIAIGRRVVLTGPATVVINLISQNLIGHPDIITQRRNRSRLPERTRYNRGPAQAVTTGSLQVDTARSAIHRGAAYASLPSCVRQGEREASI
jgi:hypothetical protein